MANKLAFNPLTQNFDWISIDESNNVSAASQIIENVPCEAAALIGHAVYFNSGILIRAQANNLITSQVAGLIESKPALTLANLRILYNTSDIYLGLTKNKIYFLSNTTPGELTDVVPTAANSLIIKIGHAASSTSIYYNYQLIGRRS